MPEEQNSHDDDAMPANCQAGMARKRPRWFLRSQPQISPTHIRCSRQRSTLCVTTRWAGLARRGGVGIKIRLTCGAELTPRRGECKTTGSVRANAAGDTGCVVAAVIVLSTSRANLRADVRIAAGGRRVTVVVELALIGAHHGLRGAFAAVLADDAVLARSGAVGSLSALPTGHRLHDGGH